MQQRLPNNYTSRDNHTTSVQPNIGTYPSTSSSANTTTAITTTTKNYPNINFDNITVEDRLQQIQEYIHITTTLINSIQSDKVSCYCIDHFN